MKNYIFAFTFLVTNFASAFCGGIQNKEPVNVQEINLDHIDEIEIQYRSEDVVILNNNSNKLILKEYMTDNKSGYFAKITNSGNKLIIEAGRRPVFNMFFEVSIEVYLPVSNKNITIKTSSGSIEAAGEYAASSMTIESSSGSISVNSITADKVNLKNSSGSINCQNVNGNTTIETSSGSIVCSIINGDLFVKSSSGRIALDQVSGSLYASTASSSIRSGTIGGNADIRTSSGSIALDQVSGSLNASTKSGSIRSGTIGVNADIRTSSGSIVASGVNGNFVAETSSASIYCAATENAGDITITTSSGSVTLDIPKNLVFNFSSRSSSGSLHTPFSEKLFSPVSDKNQIQGVIGSDNQINNKINIRTSSGSIRVNWVN